MYLGYRIPGQLHENSPSEQKIRKLQEHIERIEIDSKGMASSYAAERERMEARMMKMEEAKEERERAEAEYKRQLADLTRRLQDEANASMAHRTRLEQEVKKLQDRVATVITMLPHPIPYVQPLF